MLKEQQAYTVHYDCLLADFQGADTVLQSFGGRHAPNTIFSLFFGFGGIVVSRIGDWTRGSEDGIQPRIDEEFRALVVNSEITNLRFNGRTAEIVIEHQEHYTDEGTNASTLVRVQRFARNEYGEYFFFISEGNGRPFFKHVSHANAWIALGKKYLAPTLSLED